MYRVDYLIGDRDTQWYLTTLGGGRIQVLPVYYDIRQKTWYDPVEGLFDRPEGFVPGEINYWTNFGRNWNFQCFDCHASQIQKHFDPEAGTYDTRWQDLSINCETCHGSGSRHVVFWKSLPDQPEARDTTLVNLKFLSPEQSVEVCAQCHADKRIIALGYRPGDSFYDFYEPELLDSEKFWPDGRYRALNYNALAFMLSRCYTVGRLSCTGCHESHHLGSVKGEGEIRAYEQICLDCHRLDVGEDLKQHSHHKTVGCIGCHMPVVDEVKRIGVYDHRIASPVPANTDGFGIPNACNGCHNDKPVAWATEWVAKWWGPQDEKVAVTKAIALGRAGDPVALEGLITILNDLEQSAVLRASVAVLLGRQTDFRAQAALIEALKDEHPLVRSRAVEGLMGLGAGGEDLVGLLDDPSKLVRLRVAAALEGLETEAPEVRAQLLAALAEYREMVSGLLLDDPEAQVQAGIEALQRGEDQTGEAAFRLALKVWPGMADAYAGLGTIFFRRAQYQEAVAMWQEAVVRDSTLIAPLHRACELWEADIRNRFRTRPGTGRDYADLGDTYAIRDSLDRAMHWYQKAIESDPRYAVSYRNLALVYAKAGQRREAEAALDGYRRVIGDVDAVQKLEVLMREGGRMP